MITSPSRHPLPGGVGLWIFIVADLLLFGLYFALAASDMASFPEAFGAGKAGLDSTLGMINTIVLLTGSWAVAMGTRVVADRRQAARYLTGAALSGLVFLGVKSVEYAHHFAAGHTITSDRFFTWYFFLTCFHAVHVIVGVTLLFVLARAFRRGSRTSPDMVEAVACYWHLVDLLWIGIFMVLYLM